MQVQVEFYYDADKLEEVKRALKILFDENVCSHVSLDKVEGTGIMRLEAKNIQATN